MRGTWLLDANVPIQLVSVLSEFGIKSETALALGWRGLLNGELVSAAAREGFGVLLTRDRQFAQSAAKSLKKFSDFAIVVITLDQAPIAQFCDAFRTAWSATPIQPVSGAAVFWP